MNLGKRIYLQSVGCAEARSASLEVDALRASAHPRYKVQLVTSHDL